MGPEAGSQPQKAPGQSPESGPERVFASAEASGGGGAGQQDVQAAVTLELTLP